MPRIRRVRELLQEGLIGELQSIHAHGKQDRRGGGEDMITLGTHLFNLMRFFAGDVASASAHVTAAGRELEPADVREATEPVVPVAGDRVDAYYAFASGATDSIIVATQEETEMMDDTTILTDTERSGRRNTLDAECKVSKDNKESWSNEAGASSKLNESQKQSVMHFKRLVTIAGLSLAILGLACTTREILGCIALPVNGFLFLFNTNSHDALEFLIIGSKYMIMVGVFLLAIAWVAFPSNPTRKKWIFHVREFKNWQTIRFKTHAIVLGIIFIHIVLVKTETLIIPSICPSSGAELALKGIFGTSAFFFAIIFFLTIFFGRFLCSWLCVYAPVQEQAANLLINSGNNPNKKKRSVFLRKFIHISLAAVFWGALVMATFDNFGKITFDLTAGTFDACNQWLYVAGILTIFPLTVLLIHYLGSRYFCKYLCPIGAIMSLLGKSSFLRIAVDNSKCNGCSACDMRCQMGVDIKKYRDKNLPAIIDGDCIICGDCIDACPKDCMSFRLIPTVGLLSRSAAKFPH